MSHPLVVALVAFATWLFGWRFAAIVLGLLLSAEAFAEYFAA